MNRTQCSNADLSIFWSMCYCESFRGWMLEKLRTRKSIEPRISADLSRWPVWAALSVRSVIQALYAMICLWSTQFWPFVIRRPSGQLVAQCKAWKFVSFSKAQWPNQAHSNLSGIREFGRTLHSVTVALKFTEFWFLQVEQRGSLNIAMLVQRGSSTC